MTEYLNFAIVCEIERPINACQGIGWGKNCYRGPKPPFFLKKAHRYVFHVYALDTELTLSGNSKKKELMDAMQGHVVAETELTGLYKKDEHDIPSSVMVELAKALHTTPNYLLLGDIEEDDWMDDMIQILQKISRPEYRELAKKQIELIANIGNN